MKTTLGLCFSLVLLASSASAQAQLTIAFPAPPPLIVVSPGIQVVQDYDDEVFFVDGWYWSRQGPYWYRTRNHSGGWLIVEQRIVPVGIRSLPAGKYKRFKGGGGNHGGGAPMKHSAGGGGGKHGHGGGGKGGGKKH